MYKSTLKFILTTSIVAGGIVSLASFCALQAQAQTETTGSVGIPAQVVPSVSSALNPFATTSGSFESHDLTKAIAGYRSDDGKKLILEFSSECYPSGNVFFIGDFRRLHQVEVTWDDSNDDERNVTYNAEAAFMRPSERISCQLPLKADLMISKSSIKIKSLTSRLKKINSQELTLVQDKIARGELKMEKLPQVWKPKYLFQVRGRQDLVLIKEPAFDVHGNYQVWIGPLGKLKKIDVIAPADWKEVPAGRIQFAQGGGIFVPKMNHLLASATSSEGSEEAPTLIRTKKAGSESLIQPKLSKTQLAQLGFVLKKSLTRSQSVSSR